MCTCTRVYRESGCKFMRVLIAHASREENCARVNRTEVINSILITN